MLRSMTQADAERVQKLNANDLGYHYPLPSVKEKLAIILSNNHHYVLVYEDAHGGVVGYVHGEIYETLYAPTVINILGLVVAEAYQGRGIGKALMQGIENEAQKQGIQGIRLNSGADRGAAHRFYQHIGYRMDKEQKRFLKYF